MSSSLRVMLVTTSLMRGGAEIQVFLLAKELRRKGHEVSVVSMRAPEALEAELLAADVPVHNLGMRSGAPDPRGVLRLVRLVRHFKPDVVHSHMVHANLITRLARIFTRMPVLVSTAHNLTEGARWRELAYRATDRLASLTTNVSPSAVDRFIKVGAVPPDRIRYMPNGLDLEPFEASAAMRVQTRRELRLSDTFVWLAVGRLEEQKDYPNLLRAIATLLPLGTRPLPAFRVLIVSGGPLQDTLETLRADLGIPEETVQFLGARSDVPALMCASDGYVMSSAWEGLPMVLLEAAAAGLPIVATDVGGNKDVVLDGRTGILVPPGDSNRLAEELSNVMGMTASQRAQLGTSARKEVAGKFEIGAVVNSWIELYRELLNRAD